MKYFDAHCHVQFQMYDEDRDLVIVRMREAEVGGLVVGVDSASSQKAVELVQGKDDLYASVGLHPNDVFEEPFDEKVFNVLAADPKVRAIGECGLDYFRAANVSTIDLAAVKEKQKEVFEEHIELSVKYDKPLIVHSRPIKGTQDAYHDTIDMFISKKKEYGDKLRADMHFFVGGIEEARAFVDLDCMLSYTAVITFARDYDEVIRSIPLNNLLSETDSPYVAPAPNRGTRNEPTAVRDVIKAFAAIRDEDEEKVRTTLLENATRFFSFS